MRSPINWNKIWFTYTTKRITKLKRIGQMVVTLDLEGRDVIPGAPYLTQFFTEKDEKVNKTDWQNKWSVKMCVLAVLAYRNSFINDKVNHSNIFLAWRKKMKKKRNQSRVKRNLRPFSPKNRIPNRMSRKRVAHSMTFWQHFSLVVVRFFLFFQRFQQDFWFENSLLTMNNTVTKRH